MIKKILITAVVSTLMIPLVIGQNIEVNNKLFYGVWNNEFSEYFYGGTGLEILYLSKLKKVRIKNGLEFRSVNWGNQVSVINGISVTYVTRDQWSLHGNTSIGLGLALFVDNPLLVWSVGYMPEVILLKKRKLKLIVGAGIRYTSSPSYKDYGSIHQVLELPVKFGLQFQLGKKKSTATEKESLKS